MLIIARFLLSILSLNTASVFHISIQLAKSCMAISLLLLLPLSIHAVEKNENQGSDQSVASINIVGTGGDLHKNLTLNLPTRTPACTEPKEQVTQFVKSIKKRFRKASRAVGYYDAQFTPNTRRVEGCWKITIAVKANRPVKVAYARFIIKGQGLTQQEFKELRSKPPYRGGDVLNHQKYTDYKSQLKDTSQALGYFDAAFEVHKITVNPLRFSANVELVFNTGKRFRYGKVKIKQKVVRDHVIQSFLQIKEGDFYSSEKLIQQQQSLQSSGFYADIKISALHKQAVNHHVPIEISLKAKKRNAWKFKVGYGTDTGPRISGELNRRWTSSKGHGLNLSVTAAPKVSTFSARLTEPKADPKKGTLSYLLEWQQDTNNDIISRSYKLGAEFTRKTDTNWQETASVTYLLDTTQVGENTPTRSHLTLLGVGTEKTKADNYLFPLNGWRIKANLQGAVENIISDQSILQLKTDTKLITQLGDGRLLGRLDLGTTFIGELDAMPKDLRFFAGGGQSVRGYSFNSLGETDANGDLLGGKHLFVGSIEYDYPIIDKWGAAVFIDAGNAFNDWKKSDLKLGAGIGARWRSPVGPVRIDIGFPENRLSDPHLHLSIGSDL